MGSDFADRVLLPLEEAFQSTLPHGERHTRTTPTAATGCFNPRSHMGSDVMDSLERTGIIVSIHAPTWGATVPLTPLFAFLLVSIHAPTWGATCSARNMAQPFWFQSTLPHGERPYFSTQSFEIIWFQSTLPHGERRMKACHFSAVCMFQSTLPHGERLLNHNFKHHFKAFQSTLPHGERHGQAALCGFLVVSIHAPTWGATTFAP